MEINGVTIQMLPAASGDCIYLEFPDPDFRILIDGGYAKTYHKYLKKFLLKLAAEGKRLNLIVVTHIDDDHISGITLAFLVYRFENTFYEGQHCPEVEEWKNICTGEKAENEFAEVKNCWLLPEL